MKSVSLIIPHYNNIAKLATCLAALQSHFSHWQKLEIIVVDNGSSDDLNALKRKYPKVEWLLETSMRSPYPCRNKGIQHASGEVVVLLDSNCIPFANFLEEGLSMLMDGNDIVGGKLRVEHSGSLTSRFDVLYTTLLKEEESRTALPGAILYTLKKHFEEIGYFLAQARSLADIEWTQRAHAKGLYLALTPNSVANYQAKEWQDWVRKTIRLGQGSKEIHLQTGGRLNDLQWCWRVTKTFLPPSPKMVSYFAKRNSLLGTNLSWPILVWYCVLTKWLRGWGMVRRSNR